MRGWMSTFLRFSILIISHFWLIQMEDCSVLQYLLTFKQIFVHFIHIKAKSQKISYNDKLQFHSFSLTDTRSYSYNSISTEILNVFVYRKAKKKKKKKIIWFRDFFICNRYFVHVYRINSPVITFLPHILDIEMRNDE